MLKGKIARGLLIVKKYSPEILVGTGVVSMVASTVLACKATLRVDDVMFAKDNDLSKVNLALKNKPDEYTEEDAKKDRIKIHARTVGSLARDYAPAIITGTVGVTCILSGFGIIKKRHIALAGAYKLVTDSFDKYRGRVIEKYGKEVDTALKNGTIKQTVEKLNKKGKIEEVEEEIVDPNGYSMYSKFFDEANVNWSKVPGYNRMFLQGQQTYFNDLLQVRGHIFLNEVYQALGIPHTKEGSIVGWVKNNGDNFIDFGMFDDDKERARAFINEDEKSILLDFNVDGVIYDLIWERDGLNAKGSGCFDRDIIDYPGLYMFLGGW